jgi:hypothetical protein
MNDHRARSCRGAFGAGGSAATAASIGFDRRQVEAPINATMIAFLDNRYRDDMLSGRSERLGDSQRHGGASSSSDTALIRQTVAPINVQF